MWLDEIEEFAECIPDFFEDYETNANVMEMETFIWRMARVLRELAKDLRMHLIGMYGPNYKDTQMFKHLSDDAKELLG